MTPGTAALQAPLSIGFSWQEYWSELPFPPPVDLPDPETEHVSLTPPALAGGFFTTSATWEAHEEVVLIRVFQMLPWLCTQKLYYGNQSQMSQAAVTPHINSTVF